MVTLVEKDRTTKGGVNVAKLTQKQRAFVDYYIETLNATEAARRAGYKGKNLNRIASENLSKLDIQKHIAERMKKVDSERIASADEVLMFLTNVMRGQAEKTNTNDSDASDYVEQITYKERLKAAELLGKRHMLFTEKQQVEVNGEMTQHVNVNIDLTRLDTKELEALEHILAKATND